ncbi:MAG: cytochrome b [Oscillatoria sp. SIO1A7]|nr:cytochrome b [Oscillatoria sp. SIO1A7]
MSETSANNKNKNKPRKTSAYLQLMAVHWAMSYCYLILFMTGTVMAKLPRSIWIRNSMYDFHKQLGVLAIALLIVRIFILLRVSWKKYTRHLPKFSKKWMQKAALHGTLYLFMLAVPISGLFFSSSFKSNNIRFLGMTLPDLFPQNSDLVGLGRNLHFWFSYTFAAFIALHIIDQWKVVRSIWRQLWKRRGNLA